MCGGYNIAIEKFVEENIDKNNTDLIVLGAKGHHYFKDRGYNIVSSYDDLPTFDIQESISSSIATKVFDDFNASVYKKVSIVYTEFINSLTFVPKKLQLLPLIDLMEVQTIKKELLLEPSAEEVLQRLIPFYLTTGIKTLLFESMLSEQASRRIAMENATDNASELKDKLLLEYNKSRQASITQEITEISGAANAIQ